MHRDVELAAEVMQRCDALAACSDEPGRITRVAYSPAMQRAHELVSGWMRAAGMAVRTDVVGNLIGHYPGSPSGGRTLLLGSHLDSVRDAGRYDGPLGVLAAIACVQHLHERGERLPFEIEVIGFADEEGTRFQTTYLGSRALAGTLTEADLFRRDADGISVAEAKRGFGGDPDRIAEARRDPERLIGYFEIHIEQGPVLDRAGLPVAVVTGVAGQTRAQLTITGQAAHAGTTPAALRRDALVAAAQFILEAESWMNREPGLMATVGQLVVEPGASNVIPALARLTVDIRHADDAVRERVVSSLETAARRIASQRQVGAGWSIVQSTRAVACSTELTSLLKRAAAACHPDTPELPSGAGHDAAALAAITPVSMLFVRCKDGVSHHPAESVDVTDVTVAISVVNHFLRLLAAEVSMR